MPAAPPPTTTVLRGTVLDATLLYPPYARVVDYTVRRYYACQGSRHMPARSLPATATSTRKKGHGMVSAASQKSESGAELDQIVSSIGPKLRELRLQQGLSLQQLAERAEVSAAAIHKIE